MRESETNESKIVFKENNVERVYRGVIVSYEGDFITIERKDGTVRLNKNIVLKIETPNGSDSDGQQKTL